MAFSNKDYKRLGDRIRSNSSHISEEDYEMLQQLRVGYKDSLSTVFNTVEKMAHRIDGDCVCTYRIKRIESIISKLRRFPEMQVNRAEDIAGCRCILATEEDAYKLYNNIIKRISKLPFEIKGKVNDYISSPKPSGYKSIHLNVVVKGENKRIEIQIRSIANHNWATLVEISDLLYDLKLKENGEDSNPELFELHRLLSLPSKELRTSDIFRIADTVIKYDYIKRIGTVFAQNYIDVRKHWYSLKSQKTHFFLISTGQDGKPEIEGFLNFDTAESAYFEKFINNKSNKNIVLTHLRQSSFAKISVAYSNYFLTFNNTIISILSDLSKAVEDTFAKNKVCAFKRYYLAFLDIMRFWIEKQVVEIQSFVADENVKKSVKNHMEWVSTIDQCIRIFIEMFNSTQMKLTFKGYNFFIYYVMKRKYKSFKSEVKQNTI